MIVSMVEVDTREALWAWVHMIGVSAMSLGGVPRAYVSVTTRFCLDPLRSLTLSATVSDDYDEELEIGLMSSALLFLLHS